MYDNKLLTELNISFEDTIAPMQHHLKVSPGTSDFPGSVDEKQGSKSSWDLPSGRASMPGVSFSRGDCADDRVPWYRETCGRRALAKHPERMAGHDVSGSVKPVPLYRLQARPGNRAPLSSFSVVFLPVFWYDGGRMAGPSIPVQSGLAGDWRCTAKGIFFTIATAF